MKSVSKFVKSGAAVAAGVVLIGSVVIAPTASAVASPSTTRLQCSGTSWAFIGQSGPAFTGVAGDQLTIENPSSSGAGTVTWTLPSGSTLVSGSLTLVSNASAVIQYGSTSGALTATPSTTCGSNSSPQSVNVVISAGGGGSTPSSPTVAPARLETLTLAVSSSGATCTGGNPVGYSGSWLTLPAADQCTQSGPTAKPGAKLLGWATSASFPIARAQSQVDKKWGVIDESIDSVRTIFIPAGMATFVSGSNNLFPIWSA